ncbi:hypothetical protein HYW55_06610 [Candidatus Gottesmanbacteria bacterium]|nr:hypothetical protein [Candidatus Gottesmanbacteria bacterium]
MKIVRKAIFSLLILGFGLLLLAPFNTTSAIGPTFYEYKLGVDPVDGPVVAMDFHGDRIELTGAGTFSLNPHTVTGGGDIVHKDKDGNIINTGTWTATRMWRYQSWGTSPDLPSTFEGGRALIGVHLRSTDGSIETDGLLWVTCLIGNVPAGSEEGVTLLVPRFGLYFNTEVSGETLFIRMP